jgi:hypothetical protein
MHYWVSSSSSSTDWSSLRISANFQKNAKYAKNDLHITFWTTSYYSLFGCFALQETVQVLIKHITAVSTRNATS